MEPPKPIDIQDAQARGVPECQCIPAHLGCPELEPVPGRSPLARWRLKRLKHLFFHTVASSKMKLFPALIVLVDNSTVSSGELNRMADDSAEDRLEVESRANRLANLAQRFEFFNRSRQIAGARLQLLK